MACTTWVVSRTWVQLCTRRANLCSTLRGRDGFRHALELMAPVDYLRMSYYERWVHMLEAQLVQYGFVSKEEIERGQAAPGSTKATPVLSLATSDRWLTRGIPSSEDPH